MFWPDLIPGTLIRRYKRFLADIKLADGTVVTAHCANSGAMTACAEPGRPVWIAKTDNPKRKLAYTWHLIEMETGLVGVHTQVPNPLVALSIQAGQIPELSGYTTLKTEVKTGNSRIDILLCDEKQKDCYVEVKNCTLVEDGLAQFPDAVTTRGKKHVEELTDLVGKGNRCVMFFLIQRTDAKRLQPADRIDPAYGNALRHAHKKGVELLCYDVAIDLHEIRIRKSVPIHL